MNRILLYVSLLTLSTCTLFSSLFANNGAIAYAYPLSGITIDGDLSDWPKKIKKYPIKGFAFGQAIQGETDIQAHFWVGYDLQNQSLYVAVETTDDHIMGDTSAEAAWDSHDIHNLYVDGVHSPMGSGAISYLVSPDYRRLAEGRPKESWDPQVRNATWDQVEYKIKRTGNKTVYEWRVLLGDQLKPGQSIGFDYEVIDKDPGEEGFPSVMVWGPSGGKSFSSGRIGDVVLMAEGTKMGVLKGKVYWEDKRAGRIPNRLRIISTQNPHLWITAQGEEEGTYSLEIPEGSYQLSFAYPIFYDQGEGFRINAAEKLHVQIHPNQVANAPDLVIKRLPNPNKIPAKGILASYEKSDQKQLDQFMNTYMDHFEIPGASLALVKGGKVVYHQTYGYQNAYTEEPVEPQTLFEAASVTKPVFAFAVNRLVERGEFDLDKPLHEYLPFDEVATDDRYKLMTGRHVLVHTSGLPNWGRRMDRAPGKEFGYSGEGFEYLKRCVAHHTGRDIEKLVKEEVLDPLGISHTYFSKNDELLKVVAHGHYDTYPVMLDIPSEPGMAHSMYTEAGTFANFLIGLLDRKGLKPETYQEMFRPQTPVPNDPYADKLGWKEHFGLGIAVMETPHGKAFGHGGNNGDFRCQVEAYEEGKLGFAVFTNGSNGHLLVRALREYLILGKVE